MLFNSMPHEVNIDLLYEKSGSFKEGGFLTRETIESKFKLDCNRFYEVMEKSGFLASKVEIASYDGRIVECLGVFFAVTKQDYKQGLIVINDFIEECLTEFENITQNKFEERTSAYEFLAEPRLRMNRPRGKEQKNYFNAFSVFVSLCRNHIDNNKTMN